jgi:hypothetical protein
MQIKRAFLIFAFVAVTTFGLLYGISPRWYAATFLGITDLNVNFAHILRALAGLYLALALFWLYAAYHEKYMDAAILPAPFPIAVLEKLGLSAYVSGDGGSRRAGDP